MPDKPGEEFFYLDDDGTKQDAELHATILRPVDFSVDEAIMAPIRARHRAEHLAKQKAKARAARWLRVKARAQKRLAKYNPTQPRDEDGKWTDGGGDGPSAVPGYTPGVRGRGETEVKARRAEWVAASDIKTVDDVIRAAPVAQKAFAESGRRVAEELGVEFKDPGPKTKSAKGIDRIREKMAQRIGEPAARITDTARGAFILDTPDKADAVIAKLARTHEVVAEPWRTVDESHYTDRALLFRDRQTGLIGEVQIMDPKMWEAKKIGHELYEKSRVLPAGDPRKAELNAQMKALYDKVLDSYKGTPWEVVDGRNRPNL